MGELNNRGRATLALEQAKGYGTPFDQLPSDFTLDAITDSERDLIEQWVSDLLGDLRHLADVMGQSFDSWSDRGYMHYHDECIEEAVPTSGQIHEALTEAGLETVTCNTGGGTMVSYAIATQNGEGWVDYVGVTHEESWIIVAYHAGEVEDESAEQLVDHNLPSFDKDAMAEAVSALVAALRAGIRLVPAATPVKEEA